MQAEKDLGLICWMEGFCCFYVSRCCSEWKPADMHVLGSTSILDVALGPSLFHNCLFHTVTP